MAITNNRFYFIYFTTVLFCYISSISGFVINQRNLHLDEEMPGILDGIVPKSNDHGQELCHISVTCAWEVYRPFKRTFEYLIKNTCECPSGYVCAKSGEDLSISAYIYKCQPLESGLLASGNHYRIASSNKSP